MSSRERHSTLYRASTSRRAGRAGVAFAARAAPRLLHPVSTSGELPPAAFSAELLARTPKRGSHERTAASILVSDFPNSIRPAVRQRAPAGIAREDTDTTHELFTHRRQPATAGYQRDPS